jgi:hypothetical protein
LCSPWRERLLIVGRIIPPQSCIFGARSSSSRIWSRRTRRSARPTEPSARNRNLSRS